jgi:hypothetical protein
MNHNESPLKGFFRKPSTNLLYIDMAARATHPALTGRETVRKRVRKFFLDKSKIRAI